MRGRKVSGNDGIKRKEIRRARRGSVLILTEIEIRKRERRAGEKQREKEKVQRNVIAREIRPSIGGGGYQRNKGTAGGKVCAILAKKSLVKEVGGGWRTVRRRGIYREEKGERESERGSFLHYLETRRIKEKRSVPPPFLPLSCQ